MPAASEQSVVGFLLEFHTWFILFCCHASLFVGGSRSNCMAVTFPTIEASMPLHPPSGGLASGAAQLGAACDNAKFGAGLYMEQGIARHGDGCSQ